jgi:hypothetical protein
MELAVAVVLLAAVFVFVVGVRARDLPIPEPVSLTEHLDDRKARIYEGLRDLQFEYRVGKLSEEDYQRTKVDLQQQLAGTLAEIDKLTPSAATAAAGPSAGKAAPAPPARAALECPHCQAKFEKPMKFCGECGKAIA